MSAKLSSRVSSKAQAQVAAVLGLVIYSFIAIFCIDGQLPLVGARVGHDAPEVLHLKVDSGTDDFAHAVRKNVTDPPFALASRGKVPGLNTAPIKPDFELGLPGLATLLLEQTFADVPLIRLRPSGWAHVWLAATRWRYMVVLHI